MNSYDRFKLRLKGHPVDRPPNFDIFMTFAAHHIGKPLSEYYGDYRVLVDANMAVMEEFDLDIVQAISDPYREAADFGAEIIFPTDDMPLSRRPLLKEHRDIASLGPLDPSTGKRMSDRLKAVRLFRDKVGGEVPIMGWVEGALAEAADLRGVMNLMMDLIRYPAWVEELLEICAAVSVNFARQQIEAGADIIGLGDAIASQISPQMYRQFALPYERRVFEAVHQMGGIARLHICGDTNKLVGDMVGSGADIIDLDWMVDMATAIRRFGDQVSFCGNFDPVSVMFQGTPEMVYEATQACILSGGERSFSAAGCEIPNGTPHANINAQRRALIDIGNEA